MFTAASNMNFVVFFFLVVTARTCAETTVDDFLSLTVSNHDAVLKENEFLFVLFSASWCGNCRDSVPEYVRAVEKLKQEGIVVQLAKVDTGVELELANKYEITRYPTVIFFRSGTPFEHRGPPFYEDLVEWLRKKTGPPAKNLKDRDSVAAFKNEDEVVVIGFFKDQESDSAKEYLNVATHVEDVVFGITSESQLFADHNVKGDSIVLFKQFDEGRDDFEGDFNGTNIKNFIFINRLPLVTEFKQETVSKIFGEGPVKRQITLFSKRADSDALIKELTEVAKDFRGQFIFVYVDTEAAHNSRVLEFFGLKKDTAPALRLYLNQNLTKYQPTSDGVDAKTVRKFIQDYLDGNLKPLYLSEDIPEDWNSQPVKVLVGKNFKEVAFNKDKAVFVKFCPSWDMNCKVLAPIWDELGEAYKDSDKIVIAKIDVGLNDIEGMTITDFPTLKYFPSGSDQVIDYYEDRSLESFKRFLDSDGKENGVEQEEKEVEQDEKKIVVEVEETEAEAEEKKEEEKEVQEEEKTDQTDEEEEAQEDKEEEDQVEEEQEQQPDKAKEEL